MAQIISYLVSDGKYVTDNGKMIIVSRAGFLVQFSGYILSDQGLQITQRGFIYGTDPGQLNTSVVSSDTGTLFKGSVLLPAGTYYYKSYAINASGTSYGELKSIIAG